MSAMSSKRLLFQPSTVFSEYTQFLFEVALNR